LDPINISHLAASQHDLLRPGDASATQPAAAAPPELVGKFEALMAQSRQAEQGGGMGSVAESPALRSAVAGANSHLQHHADAIDRVMGLNDGSMSFAELQAQQVQATVQMSLLSMNQAAYLQVLGSTKGTVSALMKNQ
jgi:hypothetical protein